MSLSVVFFEPSRSVVRPSAMPRAVPYVRFIRALAVLTPLAFFGCAKPPRSSPATSSAHPSPRAALRSVKSFTFQMWTPQRADLVAHGPLKVEWVSCLVRNGVDGAPKKVSCAPAAPAPAKLDAPLREALARCYKVLDTKGSKATVLAMERQYLPGAKELVTPAETIALLQTIDSEREILIYGPPEKKFDLPPKCPSPQIPACHDGVKEHGPIIGTKKEVIRVEEPPSILAFPVVPTKSQPIAFAIAVPEYTSSDGVITVDERFAVPTDGKSELAVANELSTRLDALDPASLASEHFVVVQAYWLDRALIAMVRKDRAALDAAYEGLEKISGSTDFNSWVRSAVSTLQQIRQRGLVFDDPCR